MNFKLRSTYQPRGDQPTAIDQLFRGLEAGDKHQVLLGVTGSGKTFTMAKVIEALDRPALVLAHNKTLAAQLYHEFKSFFPENAVEYFVSYYDFYQPEAYVPSADIYIEKESTINDELDKLRMSATRSLFERRDVIIVASVSCIYGLGSPEAYYGMLVMLEKGQQTSREALLRRFVDIQYERSEDLRRGTFRVRGDIIEIYPTYEDNGYRIEMWGDQIDTIRQIDPVTGEVRAGQEDLTRVSHLSENALRHARRTARARHRQHLRRTRLVEKRTRAPGQIRRSPARHPAHHVRHGDDAHDRLLPRRRELFPPPQRPPARRSPANAARLFPAGLPALRRRIPPDHSASPRNARRRPLAQTNPGRLRLPHALAPSTTAR